MVDIDKNRQQTINQEIEEGIQNLVWQNCIIKIMTTGQFLNPKKENINNDVEVIVDEIAKAYSIGDKTNEINQQDLIISKVSYLEVMQAL